VKPEKRLRTQGLFLAAILLIIMIAGGLTVLLSTPLSDFVTVFIAICAGAFGLLFFFVVVFRWGRLRGFNFGKDKKGRTLGWPGDRW
jgi:heme A synthase